MVQIQDGTFYFLPIALQKRLNLFNYACPHNTINYGLTKLRYELNRSFSNHHEYYWFESALVVPLYL
jgi:hypothetical protein